MQTDSKGIINMTYNVPVENDVDNLRGHFPLEVWKHAEHCYSQGVRGYHTIAHACDVMTRVLYLHEQIGFMNVRSALLAGLFHDAVYVAGASPATNETASADQMYHSFTYVKKHDFNLDDTRGLIWSTANHLEPRDKFGLWDECLFMDCDMLGFADNPYRFNTQNHLIDVEFGQNPSSPSQPYLHGRITFLTMLKDRGVFISPLVRRWFEDRALANIDRELERCRQALSKFNSGVECG